MLSYFFFFCSFVSFKSIESTADAIREFNSLKSRREVKLAVYAALLHAHKQSALVDKEEIEELTARITIEEKTSSETAILQAACFYWHIGEEAKAKDYANQVSDHSDEYMNAQVLKAWLELTAKKNPASVPSSVINLLDSVLQENSEANAANPATNPPNSKKNLEVPSIALIILFLFY